MRTPAVPRSAALHSMSIREPRPRAAILEVQLGCKLRASRGPRATFAGWHEPRPQRSECNDLQEQRDLGLDPRRFDGGAGFCPFPPRCRWPSVRLQLRSLRRYGPDAQGSEPDRDRRATPDRLRAESRAPPVQDLALRRALR